MCLAGHRAVFTGVNLLDPLIGSSEQCVGVAPLDSQLKLTEAILRFARIGLLNCRHGRGVPSTAESGTSPDGSYAAVS